MTTHDEQPENNSSEPVEPKVEFISPARGSYYGLNNSEDTLKQFDKFLDPDKGRMPDIDCNFVNGDRGRPEFMDQIKEAYANPEQPNAEQSVLDGYSDKEEVIRKAREAEDSIRIKNAEWFSASIGTNHFFR